MRYRPSTVIIGLLCLACPAVSVTQHPQTLPRLTIQGLKHYSDPWYGFDMAVPQTWQRIIIDTETESADGFDSGYAVGFESPMTHEDDRYADYVMVEVLPANEPASFESSGLEAEQVVIDGHSAVRDRIWLESITMHEGSLDLVVYQATIVGIGYQIGLYAIGEQHEADSLAQVFDALLLTFRLREEPWSAY